MYVIEHLHMQASNLLPNAHGELCYLVGIDGSLIEATLSMIWSDNRKGLKKATLHVGSDPNQSIPSKVHLTEVNDAQRPSIAKILSEGQISVVDQRYPCYALFNQLKRYLKVYHLIARSSHSRQVKILPGPITYLLLAIYCHEHFQEKVSIFIQYSVMVKYIKRKWCYTS